MNKELVQELYAERNAVRDIIKEFESDWDVVDDLMQQTYTQALESEFDEKSKPLTWLCAIARNVAVDHVRACNAEKRANEVLEVYVEVDEHTAGTPYYDRSDLSIDLAAEQQALDPALIAEADSSIEDAISSMPPRAAAVAVLRAEGYTNQEVAEHLGIAEKTARNLWTESRKYFRDNCEVNTTNKIRERDGEPPLRERLSQSDVEANVALRFARRDSACRMRLIRQALPDATVAQWRDAYECSTG